MIYLIDLENVGMSWLGLLDSVQKGDEFLLFYSKYSLFNLSFPILQRFLETEARFRCIPCYVGPNGMDFQLCSELGFCIAMNPDCKYVIVSRDSGYDAVVHHWLDLGVRIERLAIKPGIGTGSTSVLPPTYQRTLIVPKPAVVRPTSINSEVPPSSFYTLTKQMEVDIPEEIIYETGSIVEECIQYPQNKRMYAVYSKMVKRFGKKSGIAYYSSLRPAILKIMTADKDSADTTRGTILKLSQQERKPIATIFHRKLRGANTAVPGPALQAISTMMEKSLSESEGRRISAVLSAMQKKFGQEKSSRYYNELKEVIAEVKTA